MVRSGKLEAMDSEMLYCENCHNPNLYVVCETTTCKSRRDGKYRLDRVGWEYLFICNECGHIVESSEGEEIIPHGDGKEDEVVREIREREERIMELQGELDYLRSGGES